MSTQKLPDIFYWSVTDYRRDEIMELLDDYMDLARGKFSTRYLDGLLEVFSDEGSADSAVEFIAHYIKKMMPGEAVFFESRKAGIKEVQAAGWLIHGDHFYHVTLHDILKRRNETMGRG